MDKTDDSDFSVGYKRPPRHSQFKPGQSGNPKGRPKKPKTFADAIAKHLGKTVEVTVGVEAKRASMLEIIAMKHISKAATGDPKSTTLVFNALKPEESTHNDNIPELLQQFREIHAHHVATERIRSQSIRDDQTEEANNGTQ